ncbi:LTA synthase family protein [Bacillaceae bacterium CLA-AA-H227]|uniref:LTA synthase family protein n=1 Tax=Robertmurraya yapensis (ex Hitch et al 2024) TaxID=3133160 RepID=A0ACC6SEP4_9BACI
MLILAYISLKKFQLIGKYFEPTDLYLITEGLDITKIINQDTYLKIIISLFSVAALIIISIIFLIRKSVSIHFKYRLLISFLSLVGIILFTCNPFIFSLKASTEGNVDSYSKLGLIGGFITLHKKSNLVNPKVYTKNEVKRIMHNLQSTTNTDPNFKPNIIIVLAEAFWDPLLLENLTFKKDPIPYFRSLSKISTSGKLLSHFYGGGTVNTELDVLTGLSTSLLPVEGIFTYNYQLFRPIDSLAHNLKNQDYHTTAIHTYLNWFYERNVSYRWLGFEKFVSMEFFENPRHIGTFIDDHEIMKQTLAELKKTKGPDFINTVTVASHGAYTELRYDEPLNSCTATQQLSKNSQYILDLYCQLLSETDDSIRTLIEGIKQLNEPTIVVIYGDHLPMLGEDYSVYREANFFEDINNYQDYLKMYSTPLLIWDNFSDQAPEEIKMTPNFLGSYILSRAKKEKSPIFQMAEKVYNQSTTIIPLRKYYKEAGIDPEKLRDYELLQHDILFGKQYSYENIKVVPDKNYFLGSEKMHIDSASIIEDGNDNVTLEIKGANFISSAKVYINGVEQETIFKNNSLLITTIKKSEEELNLTIKLKDDKKSVIAVSNQYKLIIND